MTFTSEWRISHTYPLSLCPFRINHLHNRCDAGSGFYDAYTYLIENKQLNQYR